MLNIFQSAANKVFAALTLASMLVAGLLYWQYDRQQTQLTNIVAELKAANVKIQEQQVVLKQKMASDKVTREIETQVVTETKLVRENAKQIEERVRTRIRELRESVPHDSRDQQLIETVNNEIARVRLFGLWEMYCATNPGEPNCKNFIEIPANSGASK